MTVRPRPARPGLGRGRRLWALMAKESRQIVRDPSSILIALVLPMILLFLFGYGLSLDADRIRLGLLVEDSGQAASDLAGAFTSTRFFAVQASQDRRWLEDQLAAGHLRGLVAIPSDFGRRLAGAGEGARIQLLTDGSEPNTASFVQGYAEGVLANWLAARERRQGREAPPAALLASRVWYNPELKSQHFLVPGSITIIMALIGTLLTALVVAREWERGTMEALLATPVGILEVILGKLLPYFVLGMASMALCTLAAVFLFGVPFRGSPLMLGLLSAVFLLAALGQGLLISTVSRNQFVAAQAALLTGFLPAVMLSGFIFEIASMPRPIQLLSLLMPARYFVNGLQTVFLVGDVPAVLGESLGVLAGMALLLFALTAKKTRSRLD